jgi:hypothetical protein
VRCAYRNNNHPDNNFNNNGFRVASSSPELGLFIAGGAA